MFVGRQAELAVLADAGTHTPAAVLVTGEAGIGKSRLVGEFTAGLPFVLEGACAPGCLPYTPFVTILRRLVRELGVEPRGLARLLPELGEPDESDLGRARLFEAVLGLLEQRPVVLVIEDLHWADAATLELLAFLLRNLLQPGVLVIGTCRDGPELWPLLRLRGVRRLRLPRLGREEVAGQLGGLLGHPPEPGVLERIFERSEGNPLFVEALAEAGGATPAPLRELLLAGAARLPADSRTVLGVAAVGGHRVEHELLRAVVELGDLALDDALRPVVRARLLLVEGDGYTFRHALIREAVYADLLPGERRRLHVRYGEALAGRPGLATGHWQAAGDRRRAFDTAWQAGRHERVLELWDAAPPEADHARVLELAAEAAFHAGSAERAESLATAALAEVDAARAPERAALLLERRVAIRDLLGEDGLDDLREAVRLAPGNARLAGALATSLAWNGEVDQARDLAGEAAARGDVPAMITLASLLARDGDLTAAAAGYARARALARDDTLLVALASEADALEAAGEHARAESVARRGIAEARRLGLARSRGALLAANLAEPLASLGRWPEARQVIGQALTLDPPPIYRAWLLMVLGTIAVGEGDLTGAAEILRAARPLMRGRGRGEDSCLEPDLLDCRLARAQGDRDRAARVLDHVLAEHDLAASRRYGWPLLVVAVQTQPVRQAELAAVAATLATGGRSQQAHRATFEAECGGSWEAAVTAWRTVGQPHALAETLLRAAPGAPGYLREAAALAGSLGAAGLRRAVEAAATSARVNLAQPQGPELTPRELEVLSLVAEGLSNRQIAERLFISARTSGVHVSNILAKLVVSSRVEAAAEARRLGLLR